MVRSELISWFNEQALDCSVDLEALEKMLVDKDNEIAKLKELLSDFRWQIEYRRSNNV